MPWGLLCAACAAIAAGLALPVRAHPAPGPDPGPAPAPGGGHARDPSWWRLLTTAAVALGATALLGGTVGVVGGVVGAAACWWVTGRMEPRAARRRREALTAAVPHVVDLMAACLAVGMGPASAVDRIADVVEAPMRDELRSLGSRLRLGVDPVTVWQDLARHPQLGGLGRSVVRAAESGASVAEAMQRLATDLRSRSRAEVESRARAVGVKAAVPLGVCLLPAFVLVGVVPLVAGSVSVLVGH